MSTNFPVGIFLSTLALAKVETFEFLIFLK